MWSLTKPRNTAMNQFSLTPLIKLSPWLILSLCSQAVYAQNCVDAIPASTPTSDFRVDNNGTVTHLTTGLMWKVCSEGQSWNPADGSCTGTASIHTWQQALQIPDSLNVGGGFAGYTDWRLPNIKELASIVEYQCTSPAINTTIFSNTSAEFYWSASPSAYYSSSAWGVNFNNGFANYNLRSNNNHARLVRGGQ